MCEPEVTAWLSLHVYLLGTGGITIWTGLKECLISTADSEQICSAPEPHWKPPCVENMTMYQATWPLSESSVFLMSAINLQPFSVWEFEFSKLTEHRLNETDLETDAFLMAWKWLYSLENSSISVCWLTPSNQSCWYPFIQMCRYSSVIRVC